MTATQILLALFCFAVVSIANAQSLPPEGPLSVTFTATQIPPAKPMPIGGGKEYVMVNMAMTASNDEGNPILNNMGGRCQLSRIIDPSAKTVETHGFCTTLTARMIESSNSATSCLALPTSANSRAAPGSSRVFKPTL